MLTSTLCLKIAHRIWILSWRQLLMLLQKKQRNRKQIKYLKLPQNPLVYQIYPRCSLRWKLHRCPYLNKKKRRRVKASQGRKISKKYSRTFKALWRMFWKMRAVQSKPCSQWNKWCLSLSRILIMTHPNSLGQRHLISHNSNRFRRLRHLPEAKHSFSRWWRIKAHHRLSLPLKLAHQRPAMTPLHPQLVPCSTTFSASRQKKRRKRSSNRNLAVRLAPNCHLVWMKVIWAI